MSNLDAGQVLQSAYNDSTGRLKVEVTGAGGGSSIVTVDNAAGASAVNIQDGGNSITVDGTITVQDGGGSLTVDGTFATEATLSTQSTFTTGSKGSIGASPLQLTATSIVCKKGVTVKAAAGNSGKVYVGPSGVTADTTAATDGMELSAGEAVFIEASNANLIYVVGSTTGQKVFFVAV